MPAAKTISAAQPGFPSALPVPRPLPPAALTLTLGPAPLPAGDGTSSFPASVAATAIEFAPKLVPAPAPPPARSPARELADRHAAIMDRFAARTQRVAEKALDLADDADDARVLASAISAAKSAITTYRLCAGIEGPGGGAPRAAAFDFNFGNVQPPRAGAGAAAQHPGAGDPAAPFADASAEDGDDEED